MTTPINPFTISLNLLKQNQRIEVLPFQPPPDLPFHIRYHLKYLSESIQAASLHKYQLVNGAPRKNSSSTETEPFQPIPNLQQLVTRLHSWIITNSSIIISSCGPAFYQQIEQSFTESKLLIHESKLAFKEHHHCFSEDPIFSPNKKKRHSTEADTSPLAKKIKQIKILEHKDTLTTAISPKTVLNNISYTVQEIIFLNESTFTFHQKLENDLYAWMDTTHQQISHALNFSKCCFVQSSEHLLTLQKESTLHLRRITLETLLQFLKEQKPFLEKMTKNLEQNKAKFFHSHLTKKLETALVEIQKPLTSRAKVIVYRKKKISKQVPSKTIRPFYQISNSARSSTVTKKFVKIRLMPPDLSFSFRQDIVKTFEMKNFLKKIKKASLCSQYTSTQVIDGIQPSSNNKALLIKALYYSAKNNSFLFQQKNSISEHLQKEIDNTLNFLNNLYCIEVSATHDESCHHNELTSLAITTTSFARSIYPIYNLSYISIHPDNPDPLNAHLHTISISASSTQLKDLVSNFIRSIAKHKARMNALFIRSMKSNISIKCLDNSFPIPFNKKTALPHDELCKLFSNISTYNLQNCLNYFKDTLADGSEQLYSGYHTIQSSLTFILDLFLHPFSEEFMIPTAISVVSSYLKNNKLPFFSIVKIDRSHTIKFCSFSIHQQFDLIKNFYTQSKHIQLRLKKIFSIAPFHPTKYQGILIKDSSELLSLLYWGVKCNLISIKHCFTNIFFKNKSSVMHSNFQKSTQLLEENICLIEKEWNIINPGTPIPALEKLQHSVKDELQLIMNSLTNPEDCSKSLNLPLDKKTN
ncbi:hypothetical protein CLAVI_000895 [Candidatus Clavichlamydia salmonicola]|uniref:hypothetical protein n=1 Tax=Candidatus Clavichlamydia salmonicola TaxID=469812 RepID=UPI0018910DBE|nr:hypothetical protein [Candidatus Clavichlamydia salmonicola]MBF5051254.1 hypothetical protein [Candidatus Clavichlamydia salmonicola]